MLKIPKLESKTVKLRLVDESDAEFILSLRLDERYNRFLSEVDPRLESQRSWIRAYKVEELAGRQFYFIIERNDGVPCGAVRVYDFKGDSFCWGSWILNHDKTRYAAIESTFLIYEFGFEYLRFKRSHFDVMKENKSVIKYHRKLGATQVSEDDKNIYFVITEDSVNKAKLEFSEKFK